MTAEQEKQLLRALSAIGRAADLWVILAQPDIRTGDRMRLQIENWREKWDNPPTEEKR